MPGRRAEVRRVAVRGREDPAQEQRGQDASGELCDPVGDAEQHRNPARQHEAEGDGGIEVATRDVADGRDHDRDHEAVGKRDFERARVRLGTDRHDRPNAYKHESKRAEKLDERAAPGLRQGRERADGWGSGKPHREAGAYTDLPRALKILRCASSGKRVKVTAK